MATIVGRAYAMLLCQNGRRHRQAATSTVPCQRMARVVPESVNCQPIADVETAESEAAAAERSKQQSSRPQGADAD